MDEKEIKKQAKKIIDGFMKALNKIKEPRLEFVERDEFEREEGKGEETDSDFRKIMFSNALNKKGDSILAEKKKW